MTLSELVRPSVVSSTTYPLSESPHAAGSVTLNVPVLCGSTDRSDASNV